MGIYRLRGIFHFRIGGIKPAKTYIIPNRSRENKGILKDNSNLFTQTLQSDITDIPPVYGNLAFGNILESADQINDCAFP